MLDDSQLRGGTIVVMGELLTPTLTPTLTLTLILSLTPTLTLTLTLILTLTLTLTPTLTRSWESCPRTRCARRWQLTKP